MSNFGRFVFYVALISSLLLVLRVSILVPMHSDDYFYFNLGLGVSEHLNHYMNWSGRILADYISSILLNLFNTDMVNVLNTIAVIALLFIIGQLPYALIKGKYLFLLDKYSAFSFLLIFFLYWIANPQLGHTTFWIVGSANYMWVGLIAVAYFYMLIKYAYNKQRHGVFIAIAISIFALFSGLSNESLSVAVVFISLAMVFITKFNRPMFFLYSGSSIIGFLVLIFSPGQAKRSNIDAFSDWYSLSFTERLYEHFVNRIPSIVGQFWILLVVIVIVCLGACLTFKNVRDDNASSWMKLGALFFIATLVSLAALVGAPYIPLRSTNAALILMLCSLSCLLALSRENGSAKIVLFGPLFLVVISYFSMSYYLMFHAMESINKQNNIRNAILLTEDANIVIPGFYMTKLMKDSDSIDYLHHSAASMQRYYDKREIVSVKMSFDYSQVNEDNNLIKKTRGGIVGVWPYRDGLSNRIAIGFDCSSLRKVNAANMSFFAHVYYGTTSGMNTGFLNIDPQGEMSEFNGVCYKTYLYAKDFEVSNIGKIEYGLYSPVTGERESTNTIDFLGNY
ncbi:DUF6056 family protein [Aeromonas enteropelogenes]|uniref:DUF6056 family protein n=1 Tax=Aeromonas enteropelogenes TaxID=29489 RepID=UPI003B9F52DF